MLKIKSSNKKNNAQNKASWITDSIIVAISPIIAYLIVYSYEIGYAKTFGIPLEFISINFSSFFVIASSLLNIILIPFLVINIFIILFHGSNNPIINQFKMYSHVYIMLIGVLFAYAPIWERIWPVFIFIIVFTAISFILPIFKHKEKGKYLDRLRAQQEEEAQTVDVSHYVYRFLGKNGYHIFIFIIVILFLSNIAGESTALKKEEFLISSDSSTTVVLRRYADNFIYAKYNENNKELYPNFNIVKIDSNDETEYSIKKIGPLKVKK